MLRQRYYENREGLDKVATEISENIYKGVGTDNMTTTMESQINVLAAHGLNMLLSGNK